MGGSQCSVADDSCIRSEQIRSFDIYSKLSDIQIIKIKAHCWWDDCALNPWIMIKNYLLVAFRNLTKNKGFSFINIFGLAIGMAACLLITAIRNVRAEF